MPENNKDLTDEEFIELFQSSTEEERLEICRVLADFVKENREICGFTDEQIAGNDAKFERYAQTVEDKKRVVEIRHKAESALALIEDRLNDRAAAQAATESPMFFDDSKDNKSH